MTFRRGMTLALLIATASCRVKYGPSEEPIRESRPPDETTTKPDPALPTVAQDSSKETFSNRRLLEFAIDEARIAGRKGVELWYSTDSTNWINHGFFESGARSARFLAPRDARYEVVLVPVDKADQREFTPRRGTKPHYAIVVDTVPPAVEVLAPNGGELLRAGHTTVIRWAAEDASLSPASLRLEISSDGQTWIPIARDLANTGSFHWDIPRTSSRSYRIRAIATDLAGNTGMDASDEAFTVDGLPPGARILGPSVSIHRPVKIEYAAEDVGGAGVKKVALYLSRDGGQTWAFAKEDDDTVSPLLFEELDGAYSLYLVATDTLGNAIPAPIPGTKPQATLILDTTKPEIRITAPTAGTWLGGHALDILWTVRDNVDLPRNAVTLSWSADNGRTWSEIERSVPADAPYRWKVPAKSGDRYRIRVAARDTAGNLAEAVTDAFAVDEQIPTARVTGPARSAFNQVRVEYDFSNRGFSKITAVTLYYSPDAGAHWYKYDVDLDGQSPVIFSKADGTYGLYAVASCEAGDRAGFVAKAPADGTAPQATVVIDATPPILTLETFHKGGSFAPGSTQEILWTMREAHPDAAGLTILLSTDEGATWTRVVSGIDPSAGRYAWTLPTDRVARARIKLLATDAFGNRGETVSDASFAIGEERPGDAIVLKGLDSGQEVAAASDLALSWSSADPSLREVELELSEVDPDKWKSLGRFSTRSIVFRAPLQHGRYAVRVRGLDGEKRTVTSNAISFLVGLVTAIRISADETVEPGGTVSVIVLPLELARNVAWAKLELFDGAWKALAEVKESPARFVAPSREGEYAVRVVAKDRKDRELLSNEAVFRVRSRKGDATVALTLLNFSGRPPHQGGATKLIAIRTNAKLEEIRVQLSSNSGRTWEDIPKSNLVPTNGGLLWKTLPATTGTAFRLRIVHGASEDTSSADFTIDHTPPRARIVGPAGPVRTFPMKLDVRLEKSVTEITGISLFVTRDGGRTWRLHQIYQPGDDVTFTPSEDGEHGFYATATSEVGLSGAAPTAGTVPQHRIVLGKTPVALTGSVELVGRMPRLVKGGTTLRISWKGESTDPDATVAIYLNADGAQTVLRKGLPVTGSWDWEVPLQDVQIGQVRVGIEAGGVPKFGKWSNDFIIDGTPPKVTGAHLDE